MAAENIGVEVTVYKENIQSLVSAVEYPMAELKPAEELAGDVPAWTNYAAECKGLLDTLAQYDQMLLVSAQDFEAAADLIIAADQEGAAAG